MKFKEHLKKYLTDELINDLYTSTLDKRTNSLILNTNKIDASTFKKLYPNIEAHPFIKNAFYYDKNEYSFGKNFLFDNGAYYIIDASSMLVSYFLPINENDLVLDLCAAPGGKSIFLALIHSNINIIANDISHERCLKMSSNVEKLGLSNIVITNYNFLDNRNDFYDAKFDKIILDAPCSGSAMFRKNEDAKNDWSYEKVLSLSKIQLELLKKAYKMLKKDGIIAYSTCSFSYEENEEVIFNFLNEFKNASLFNIPENKSFYKDNKLKEAIHLFPHLYKGEGQFLCLIKKNEGDIKSFKELKNSYKPDSKFITNFKLNFNYYFKKDQFIYGSNINLDLGKISLIRYGINLYEEKKNVLIPSFNLAHFLDSSFRKIELNEQEFKDYLKGLELNIKPNFDSYLNFYLISHLNINLGFAKLTNNKLKNFYPKGLRH